MIHEIEWCYSETLENNQLKMVRPTFSVQYRDALGGNYIQIFVCLFTCESKHDTPSISYELARLNTLTI